MSIPRLPVATMVGKQGCYFLVVASPVYLIYLTIQRQVEAPGRCQLPFDKETVGISGSS